MTSSTPERVNKNTRFIEVDTLQYPVFLSTITAKYNDRSFAEEPLLVDIQGLGYEKVEDSVVPSGDVVTEGQPVLRSDGKWYRGWVTRPYNPQEYQSNLDTLKKAAYDQATTIRDRDFYVGMPYTFNGVEYHIQIRPAEDRPNLITQNMSAQGLVGGPKASDAQLPFRTYENITLMLTPDQMIDMTTRALDAGVGIYARSWAVKDQIDAATTPEEIPQIPATFIV